MDTAEPASAAIEPLVFDEKIELGTFFGLSFKNALLNIITLTLYRFWGKTEVRRRLWARIRMNGEAFEYTGRGKELFFGFLIALVTVGVPYLAVIIAIQLLLPPEVGLLLLIPIYLVLFVLVGCAIFLVFRYLASRTTWRGVRFQVKGKALDFGLAYLGYSLLTGITFGWYAPAMTMRLNEKLWSGLRFGDQPFGWSEAKTPSIYLPFAVSWVLGVGGYVVLLGLIFSGMAHNFAGGFPSSTDPEVVSTAMLAALAGVAVFLPIYFIALLIAWAAYHAAVLRRVVGSLRLGEARFSMKVGALSYIGLVFVNLLILIFSLGILVPLIQARTARFMIRRLKSEGGAPIHAALQAPTGPRTAEGLADAFDLGII